MTIKKATKNDLKTITDIAVLLYDPSYDEYDEIFEENAELLEKEGESMWLCYAEDNPVAFAHASLRHDYVEGTSGGTVGYLEGIYVMPEYRNKNIARELVGVCENWARENGCTEFASDCLLDNIDSYNFHLKMGFLEANKIICFTKKL